jgi:hypothetical protein
MLRRVEVAHAVIFFGEDVPASQRHKCNSACLSAGLEVRITAHQDSSGEWRAEQVEIIRTSPKMAGKQLSAAALLNFTSFSSPFR